jgi:small-conductance mechanosensitive channel
MIRARVVVGVAYGSPVETVTAMLLEAVQKNDSILNTPEPFVIFDDFGDNALVFEIYFWIIVRGLMEKKRIASDLRYQIIALFNKNNIVIAFPQRDIHVDSLGPVQVQLLEPAEAESATR